MNPDLVELFDRQRGVATSGQILAHMSRRAFESAVNSGVVERIWQGIYCLGEPDDGLRLRGLDLACGTSVPICLGTAAAMYGFDTEEQAALHVLSPVGSRLRSADGLVVHRRDGAPLTVVDGRPVTAPAWTAIEVARSLRRPRALATLDAALKSGTCQRPDLWRAALDQAGRRGIVDVRNLIPLADGRAESPMESEVRLVMIDGSLPTPEVQYDGLSWHSGPEAMLRDRRRTAALMDVGWVVVAIVFEDVRYRSAEIIARIDTQLRRARAA